MSIIVVDVKARTENELIAINAKYGDIAVRSMLIAAEMQTKEQLAAWLLDQSGRNHPVDTELQKRLTIAYHIEQVVDPEGELVNQTIVDSVAAEPLPVDDGRANFENLPGWATWTATEASDWIETNVTDMTSAKIALQSMAKAIIYLRNITVD